MADEPKPKTPQEIWGGELQGQCQAQSLQGLQSQASGLAQQAEMGQSIGEISEEALANGAGSELTAEGLLASAGAQLQGLQQWADQSGHGQDLYEARIIGTAAKVFDLPADFFDYAFETLGIKTKADFDRYVAGGLERAAKRPAAQRIDTPPYDEARMKLADTCGVLKKENTELLAANARLSRDLESAHRELAALRGRR